MAEARKSDQFVQLYRLPPGDRSIAAIPGHDCVVALRALGEDTRVRIVGLLIHDALDVGEIAKRLGVSQYNVSKHLRILREAGLVRARTEAQRRMYELEPGPLAELDAWLAPYRQLWEARLDALERHLDRRAGSAASDDATTHNARTIQKED